MEQMPPELAEVVYGNKKIKQTDKDKADKRLRDLSGLDIKNKDKEEIALVMNEIVDLALFIMRD